MFWFTSEYLPFRRILRCRPCAIAFLRWTYDESHYNTITAHIKANKHVWTREQDVSIRYFTSIIRTIKARRKAFLIWSSSRDDLNELALRCPQTNTASLLSRKQVHSYLMQGLSQIVFQSCLYGWGQTEILEAGACQEINGCIILKAFLLCVFAASVCWEIRCRDKMSCRQ